MRAFITLLLVAVATAELAPLLKNTEPIPGKYIIKIKDDVDMDSVVSTVSVAGGQLGHIFKNVLKGFAAGLTSDLLELVRGLPEVEYVEEDGVYRAMAVGSWGLDRIDQRNLPLNDAYSTSRGSKGSGYTVYVVDTGIRHTHNDFGSRASYGWDYQSSNQGDDCNGHGTHCAGTVAGSTYGVAPSAKLKSVRVLSCWGSGSTSNIVAGVNWIATQSGNRVASMSLGGGASTSLDNAVKNLVNDGCPVAVAAGNEDQNACNVSPARESTAVTVGSTTSTDARSSFSNYGSCLDIFAPGSSIKSAWHTSNSATNTISGTSMACPHVAGAIALYGGNANTMLANTSNNKLSSTGLGSPNKLLYV